MWILIFLIVVVGIGVISGLHAAKEQREEDAKEQRKKERLRSEFVSQYGCTKEELEQKIRSSPHVHKLAREIVKYRPESFTVETDWISLRTPQKKGVTGIWLPDNKAPKSIFFCSLGLTPLPQECVGVLVDTLKKEPLLSEYEVCSPYIHRFELRKKEEALPKCTW